MRLLIIPGRALRGWGLVIRSVSSPSKRSCWLAQPLTALWMTVHGMAMLLIEKTIWPALWPYKFFYHEQVINCR